MERGWSRRLHILFDVAGAEVDADDPGLAGAAAERDLDLDPLVPDMSRDCLFVMVDRCARARDDNPALRDAAPVGIEVDARRAGRGEQPSPIGVAAVPAALDEIV